MIYILLSTYNGERFLPEQLDSIVAQTRTDWRLFVRDDGSTDGTRAVLDYYARKDTRIVVTTDGKNLGAKRSFMSLLEQYGEADYFAFADQDDVWDANKLELCVTAIQQAEHRWPNSPIVVHTDLRVVDEQLQEIAPSFWRYCNIQPEVLDSNVRYMAFCTSVTGCAMLFNSAARRCSLPMREDAFMHDWWITQRTMLSQGYVVPIYRSTVAYRQHGSNVVGAKQHSLFKSWNQRKQEAELMYSQAYPDIFANKFQFWCWKMIYYFHRIIKSIIGRG